MDLYDSDPDEIATVIVSDAGNTTNYRPVETDGAAKAAAMIAELI